VIVNFDGVVAILLTPFDENGAVDAESLQRLACWYRSNGVAAIVTPAMASEVDKLSLVEREWVVKEAVAALVGDTPVIGGVLGETGKEAARLAEAALKAGCSAILCRAPEQLLSDPEAAFLYFTNIASVGMQHLVIQDVSVISKGIDNSLILKLYQKIPAFRNLKLEVEMTNYKATQLIEATDGDLHIWSGWALLQMIEALDRGIRTFSPSAFHKPYVEIARAYFAGNRPQALALFHTILPYVAWSRQNGDINLQLLKRFCVAQGLIRTSHTRQPVHPFDRYHETYAGELIASMLEWQESVYYAP